MRKLFLRLYLLIMLGVFIILGVGIPVVIDNSQFRELIDDIAELNYQLMRADLQDGSVEEWSTYVENNQSHFDLQLAILPIDDIPLSSLNKKRIWNNEMVVDELDREITGHPEVDRFYNTWSSLWRINDSKYALLMAWETSEVEIRRRFMSSITHFVRQRLVDISIEEWPEILKKIQNEANIPTKILSVNDDRFNTRLRELSSGDTISYPGGDDIIVHFQPVSSIPYVVSIGPLAYSYSDFWENTFLIALSSAIFSIMLLLFLWPLWQSLKGLDDVTSAFGGGTLEARIPVKKRSPIANILTTFNSMADRIHKLVQSQKDLVSAVSHELRTPIAGLRFGIDAIVDADDKKERSEYVKRMNYDLDRLDSLVGELLYYTRLDMRAEINLEDNRQPYKWFKEQVDDICFLYPTLGFDIILPNQDVKLRCDFRLMSRAVTNLLNNAGRYAVNKVQLSFEEIDNQYQVIVDDDGAGIPVDQRVKAFDPFERLDASRDRRTGGHGLGLAIVKNIAQQHQGEVLIDDSPLGGCRVIVSWPVSING